MNENAKKIVEEQTLKLLDSGAILIGTDKTKLDNIIEGIYTIYNSPISKVAEERDAQYAQYRELISLYGKTLGEIKFNLLLSKEEYLLLKNIIVNKLEYDRQNLFIGLLVRDNFFHKFDTDKNYTRTALFTSDSPVEAFSLDINEITRISHLTGLYTIQGLDKKADTYANIIKKIGDISKIFEIYNSKGQTLSEEGGNWIQGFEQFEQPQEIDVEKVENDTI